MNMKSYITDKEEILNYCDKLNTAEISVHQVTEICAVFSVRYDK